MPRYASPDQFRDYMGQVRISADKEFLIEDVLDRASDLIDLELGFSFAGYSAGTRTVQSYGGSTLWLPPHQQGTVSAVTWNGVSLSGYTELSSGHLSRTDGWPVALAGWGVTEYVVTANWGYGTAPPALVEVCLEVAVNLWREKDTGSFSDVIGVQGDGQTQVGYKRAWTNRQQHTLDNLRTKYRMVVV